MASFVISRLNRETSKPDRAPDKGPWKSGPLVEAIITYIEPYSRAGTNFPEELSGKMEQER